MLIAHVCFGALKTQIYVLEQICWTVIYGNYHKTLLARIYREIGELFPLGA